MPIFFFCDCCIFYVPNVKKIINPLCIDSINVSSIQMIQWTLQSVKILTGQVGIIFRFFDRLVSLQALDFMQWNAFAGKMRSATVLPLVRTSLVPDMYTFSAAFGN